MELDNKYSLIKGNFYLLITAIIWGVAFIFQKTSSELLDAFSFNALRFGLGSLSLLCLFLLPKKLINPKKNKKKVIDNETSYLMVGSVAGIFMFIGISLQQIGLAYTTAGKSGFFTALYIVFVPILALFIRQRCRLEVWVGIVFSIIGVYILGSGEGTGEDSLNFGDFLSFLSAWWWAAQVLWLSVFARNCNVLKMVVTQMIVVALLSIISMIISNMFFMVPYPSMDNIMAAKVGILFTGVVSTGIAFVLQVLGQKTVPATNAALVMSLESVFALIAGILFLNELITLPIFVGCSLMLIGAVFAQLKIFKKE